VVEFTEDSSVDVVPCQWLEDDRYCLWPPYRNDRLVNAIKKCEQPQESWLKCSMRVLQLFGMENQYKNVNESIKCSCVMFVVIYTVV
jgi:hypothetical protein